MNIQRFADWICYGILGYNHPFIICSANCEPNSLWTHLKSNLNLICSKSIFKNYYSLSFLQRIQFMQSSEQQDTGLKANILIIIKNGKKKLADNY